MRRLIELSHLDLCCLQKPIIIACGSERQGDNFFVCVPAFLLKVPYSKTGILSFSGRLLFKTEAKQLCQEMPHQTTALRQLCPFSADNMIRTRVYFILP